MFISRNTIEQKQEKCLGEEPFSSSDIPVWHGPVCAWCLSEQGIPAGEGSHGICKMHARGLVLQLRKLRSSRIATSVQG